MRELPYGFEVLIENVLDPAHVPFAHHGSIGNRNDVAISRMKLTGKMDRTSGFGVDIETLKGGASDLVKAGGKHTSSKLFFEPPTLVR